MARYNFRDLVAGYGLGRQMVQDYNATKQQEAIGQVVAAKPEQSQGYTAADGQQLESIAGAQDASGNPAYTMGAKFALPDGGEFVQQFDKATGAPTAQPPENAKFVGYVPQPVAAPDSPGGTIAARGVTDFMGQRYEGAPAPEKLQAMRSNAIADVLLPTNPVVAQQMRRQVTRDEQDAQAFAQNQTLTEQRIGAGKRDEEQAERNRLYDEERVSAFASSPFGAKMADYAKQFQAWEAAGKPEGKQPARPSYSLADSLHTDAAMFDVAARNGKLAPEQIVAFQERMQKIKDEGYGRALTAAQNGAPLAEVARAFNESGGLRFNPQDVVSDTLSGDGKTAPKSRVITLRDGTVIDTRAGLEAIGQGERVLEAFYRQKQDRRADAESGRAGARYQQDVAEKKARSDAAVNLAVEQADGSGKPLTAAQREAVRTGIVSPVGGESDKNAPSEVKLASALLKAGYAKDMKEALGVAMSKSESPPGDLYAGLVRDLGKFGDSKAAEKAAAIMREAGFTRGADGRWSLSAGGASAGNAPYKEGTRLRGKDGKMYVVKGGQPVLDQ